MNIIPHQWQKEIEAWAAGKQLQYRITPLYYSLSHCGIYQEEWNDLDINTFEFAMLIKSYEKDEKCEKYEFRIKPNPVILRYRNALIKTKSGEYKVKAISGKITETHLHLNDSEDTFIVWIDDVKEVDITPVFYNNSK